MQMIWHGTQHIIWYNKITEFIYFPSLSSLVALPSFAFSLFCHRRRHHRQLRHRRHGLLAFVSVLDTRRDIIAKVFDLKVDGKSEKDIWVIFYGRLFMLLFAADFTGRTRCECVCLWSNIKMSGINKIFSLVFPFVASRELFNGAVVVVVAFSSLNVMTPVFGQRNESIFVGSHDILIIDVVVVLVLVPGCV